MIKQNLGKILLAGNIIAFLLLFGSLFTKKITIDLQVLILVEILLCLNAFALLYYVIKTYLYFKEKDILVGTVGFVLIATGYFFTALLQATNLITIQSEAAINMIITIGYLFITIAVGWIK